jgi:hypothetical protein
MIDPHGVLIREFAKETQENYTRNYGGASPEIGEVLSWFSRTALQLISQSDSLYHDVEHTIMAASVAQYLLEGKHILEGGVTQRDWLRVMVATLCHDVGFSDHCCTLDNRDEVASGIGEATVSIAEFPTNASLMPYHVDRSKTFVRERFGGRVLFAMDAEELDLICDYIEMTRFPIPEGEKYQQTHGYGALVRAADLIGQLSDPRYLQKIPALYHEFTEFGVTQALGYTDPRDLAKKYPQFFKETVYPMIRDSLKYLDLTPQGRQWVANLYSNLCRVESESW